MSDDLDTKEAVDLIARRLEHCSMRLGEDDMKILDSAARMLRRMAAHAANADSAVNGMAGAMHQSLAASYPMYLRSNSLMAGVNAPLIAALREYKPEVLLAASFFAKEMVAKADEATP